MKANEIQIGDWVYNETLLFGVPYGEDIQVRNIYKDLINYVDSSESGLIVGYRLNECKPIPLTAEILEKNGWRYDSELNNWWHEGVEFLIWHDEKIGFYCCNITTITLNEVHRLQHLLRLCGLNELADNFKV